ncbi:Kiwa anti-phage protein KwaB-like domain-containing protein [Limosilactobacillus caccae]|uniref:Kiwa anti-phage protein KwaB-like domain-containing protein n=1 Tax=Limosilactobacillus caccae TaxID=1926284 RepID=UPI000970279A|nr:Kiwa anti-phage protein KwaB-like domain-containing protein [Limosilactobacillus caccae]
MNLDEMLDVVKKVDSDDVNLYMVHNVNSIKGRGYSVVNPTIGNTFKQQLQSIAQDELTRYEGCPQAQYNPTGTLDNVVEKAKVKSVKPISTLKEALDKPLQKFNFNNDSFNCFIYEFPYKDKNGELKSLLVFRRTKKFKSFKKGFIGYLNAGTFQKLKNSDMLATDEYIDFIMDEEDIYIFQHISFERIFNLRSKFVEKAKSVLSNTKLADKIENFDKLREEALDNQSYVKRLAKLSKGKNDAALFLEDLDATKKVINDFNLDIKFNEAGDKLVFRGESQVASFIGLMQDAYYQTLIGKHKGMDKRR